MRSISHLISGGGNARRPLLGMVSSAASAARRSLWRSTTSAIPPSSEPSLLRISPPSVAVPMDATMSSPTTSGDGDTKESRSSSSTLRANKPGGPEHHGYQTLTFRIRGVSPLLMHNGQLADPLNRFAREMRKISGKRKKVEADYEQLARLEFLGGLYLQNGEPCIPGELIEAGFIQAAMRSRMGQQAKAGVISDGFWPLEYDGPHNPHELWEDDRFRSTVGVKVQRSRVMRTRPIFHEWAATVRLDFLVDQLDAEQVIEAFHVMGRLIGIGDWRPKFGRFIVDDCR